MSSAEALVIGVGCRAGVGADQVRVVVAALLARHGLDQAQVRAYATVSSRADEPGLREVAGPALLSLPASALASVPVPNPSRRVADAVGTPSVAEAAALCGAARLAEPGTVVELVGPKLAGTSVTASVARIRPARGR